MKLYGFLRFLVAEIVGSLVKKLFPKPRILNLNRPKIKCVIRFFNLCLVW